MLIPVIEGLEHVCIPLSHNILKLDLIQNWVNTCKFSLSRKNCHDVLILVIKAASFTT